MTYILLTAFLFASISLFAISEWFSIARTVKCHCSHSTSSGAELQKDSALWSITEAHVQSRVWSLIYSLRARLLLNSFVLVKSSGGEIPDNSDPLLQSAPNAPTQDKVQMISNHIFSED